MFEHSSGVVDAFDRTPANPNWKKMIFREGKYVQATEFNEVQSILADRAKRNSDLIAKDGDRIVGGDILVDPLTGTVILGAGEVYALGDIYPVAAVTMNAVPMTGIITVGIRVTKTIVTEEDDPTLYGLAAGTLAEGEPGAVRELHVAAWGHSDDGEDGDLIAVYLIKDGVVVDQTPPPDLTGVNAQIAVYDRDAHGSYIVDGCIVTATGKVGGDQVFSISEGVANIWGFKRSRSAAILHRELEAWDTEAVTSEAHTYSGSGSSTILLNHSPLAAISALVITKETTQTITKGLTGTSDNLPHSSVTSIIEVKQGGTTYTPTTDYILNADKVDWSPAGIEPSASSTYTVKYRYMEAVTADATTPDSVTVSGGVNGTTVLISYTWKLPRVDALCLDQFGFPAYVKGISLRANAQPPIVPFTLLPLAEVSNNWIGIPTIKNVGVRSFHFTKIQRMYDRLIDALDHIGILRLKQEIDRREPNLKKGVFADPLIDNTYRDAGVSQNAAVFQGSMQLPVTPTFFYPTMAAPLLLDYTSEVIVEQPLITGSIKINPYNSYELLPASMKLEPPVDFWVDQPQEDIQESVVTQQVTQEVVRNVTGRTAGTTVQTTVREQISVDETLSDVRVANAQFMRQVPINVTIDGFGVGENLATLLMGGVSVKPPGTQTADGTGRIVLSFTIPANMPAGRVYVTATGAGGSYAQALFAAAGYYDLDTIQRVTTITQTTIREVTIATAPRPQGGGGGLDKKVDPVSQTFMFTDDGRMISAIGVKFAAFGNKNKGLLVEIVRTDNGFPTGEPIASAFASLVSANINEWVDVTFSTPVFIPAGVEHAFICRTDDDDHALCLAEIGGFDPVAQQRVGAQPYSIGMLLSSANAKTWTAHQREDLTFRIKAAKFAPLTKTINLGTFSVASASDLAVKCGALLPSAETTLAFEFERPDGSKMKVRPNQNWEMDQFVTGNVIVRALLAGTEKLSPVLFTGATLVAGSLQTTATYVSEALKMGTAIRLSAYMKMLLPVGSTAAVHFDKVDNVWTAAAIETTEALDLGWIEREYRIASLTAVEGRMRITLTGTPAARPSIQDLRAISI